MDELNKLRQQIDAIDDELFQLIQTRISIMKSIGVVKKQTGIEIKDFQREKNKINILEKKAFEKNIPPEIITKIWDFFFTLAEQIE